MLFRARDHRSLDGDLLTGGTIGLHRPRPKRQRRMADSGFFGAQRPRGGSIAAGEKSRKPPLQEGDRPSVRSARERPRGAAWGRYSGDIWGHSGHSSKRHHPWYGNVTSLADVAASSCRVQPVAPTPPAFTSMDKRIGRHMVMHFAVERSFWSSDKSRRAPDSANQRQCRARATPFTSGSASKTGYTPR